MGRARKVARCRLFLAPLSHTSIHRPAHQIMLTYCLFNGFTSATATLSSQSLGAKNMNLTGIWLQTGIFCGLVSERRLHILSTPSSRTRTHLLLARHH